MFKQSAQHIGTYYAGTYGQIPLRPRLQELPILKMGRHLVQLPWMQAMQNNRVAAINNLRRLRGRQERARDETRRIEQRLGEVFVGCGFKVLVGHALPVSSDEGAQVEEIDLLCARDGRLHRRLRRQRRAAEQVQL